VQDSVNEVLALLAKTLRVHGDAIRDAVTVRVATSDTVKVLFQDSVNDALAWLAKTLQARRAAASMH
jgi:hypothetical protein